MIVRLIAAALILAASPALAIDAAPDRPPRLDVDGRCSREANSLEGFSPDSMQHCLAVEDEALHTLKWRWRDAPDYVKDGCVQRERASHNESYADLDSCIRHLMATEVPPLKPKAKTTATPGAEPRP